MYEIQRKIAKEYKGKKINYKGEEITIKEINVSLWSEPHNAIIEVMGKEFFLDMMFNYNKKIFEPTGDYGLLFR